MAQLKRHPIGQFETDRLILRRGEMKDAPRIQTLFANWNVLKYMTKSIPWPYPENGAVEYLESIQPKIDAGEMYYWAILERDAQKHGLIGVISLDPLSEKDNRGFWLGEPYWGRGYMTEATAVVNDFAFDVLEMPEMLLGNAEPNVASHRLKEKAGAEIIGIEDSEFVSGTLPSIRWRLTAAAWRSNRDRYLSD